MTDPIIVDLEFSMVLVHKHGQKFLLHEREIVRKGDKRVIRSDLLVK